MRLIDPFVAVAIAAGLLTSGVPARAATYQVNQWPQDIGKLPCDAWTRSPDGSWKQFAQIQRGPQQIVNQNFAAASSVANMLNAKCGAK